jgi:hypothetical protein
MTAYVLPQDKGAVPHNLLAGDTLTVDDGGRSENVTVHFGAIETVNPGGTSDYTTIDYGSEFVHGGKIDHTIVDQGTLAIGITLGDGGGATADHTTIHGPVVINGPQPQVTQVNVLNRSVADNTTIENGYLTADASSTIVNVTFSNEKITNFVHQAVAVDNPLNLKGDIKGLHAGDFLQFGGLERGANINVTSFTLSKDQHDLKIYDGKTLLGEYHLTEMQGHTTFDIIHETSNFGVQFSKLIVVPAHTSLGADATQLIGVPATPIEPLFHTL